MCRIKTLLDSSVGASIVRKDGLYKHHKILQNKNNKWSTMEGTFKTTFVTETIIKLLELNYSAIIYVKCHLTNKLINYNLILGHKIGIIFNF